MKIKRLVPASESSFTNTEEKLKEFFDSHNKIGFRIPLSINRIPSNRYIDFYLIDINDVVGYVEGFTEEDMEVTITRDEFIKNINIDDLRVDIVAYGGVVNGEIRKIVKLVLKAVSPDKQ